MKIEILKSTYDKTLYYLDLMRDKVDDEMRLSHDYVTEIALSELCTDLDMLIQDFKDNENNPDYLPFN